jgi:hypothetical protein
MVISQVRTDGPLLPRLKRGSAAKGAYSSPTSNREKRAMRTFSPVLAAMSVTISAIVFDSCFSVLKCCSPRSARSPAHFFSCPSTIF